MTLFSPKTLGPITLKNRVVMAPMTRSRAIGNLANDLIADYYTQRASTGLIITEGTSPSPEGLGYPRIPGLFSSEQAESWKSVTEGVHQAGGRIFTQLMHTGRIAHPLNMPAGTEIIAPSAVQAAGAMFTDQEGMQDHPLPKAMNEADMKRVIGDFVEAARHAVRAGFDGVEIHAANGYLLTQFLDPRSNHRTDSYGGSPENRNRFVVEVARAVADAIGADRVGIRISPHSTFNDLSDFEETREQYAALAREIDALGLVYLHLLVKIMGGGQIPQETTKAIRDAYKGTLILNGGYDRESAEAALQSGDADLVSFGVPFIANPDLVERMAGNLPLAEPRMDLFYTPGGEGYVDYPVLEPA